MQGRPASQGRPVALRSWAAVPLAGLAFVLGVVALAALAAAGRASIFAARGLAAIPILAAGVWLGMRWELRAG